MYEVNKAQLPPSDLGTDRCFQACYYGHGDIFLATWSGPVDHNPTVSDGMSTCFNLSHGNDTYIFAALIGFLSRLDFDQEQINAVVLEAGREIIEEDMGEIRLHRELRDFQLRRMLQGGSFPRLDLPDDGLVCLMPPAPSQPGVIQQVGGTGFYTRPGNDVDERLVIAQHIPTTEDPGVYGTKLGDMADFCSTDVPAIASLIFSMSLGEYRRDLKKLITVILDENADCRDSIIIPDDTNGS